MSSVTISLIVFACIFGGALLGIFLHAVSASASSGCGFQRYREAGHGTGRDDGCPRSRPAGRLGQGLLRRAKRGTDADVGQYRLA